MRRRQRWSRLVPVGEIHLGKPDESTFESGGSRECAATFPSMRYAPLTLCTKQVGVGIPLLQARQHNDGSRGGSFASTGPLP